jgi:hypothetical protein
VIKAGSEAGALLVDGLGDGILLEAEDQDFEFLRTTSFGMLQGCRMRNTKTEYVSCPSCGRTLFDLQEISAQIREKTAHLPGVAVCLPSPFRFFRSIMGIFFLSYDSVHTTQMTLEVIPQYMLSFSFHHLSVAPSSVHTLS